MAGGLLEPGELPSLALDPLADRLEQGLKRKEALGLRCAHSPAPVRRAGGAFPWLTIRLTLLRGAV